MAVDADLAVVGSGPVGSALAVMMGRARKRVVLLDRRAFPRDKACGEGLMPAGVTVLEGLDIDLSAFPTLAGVSYRMPGAGSAQGGFARGRPGRGVRRLTFDALLAETAASTPNVRAAFGCTATSIQVGSDGVTVETTDGALRATTLVGADGHHSSVARWVGWARPARPPHRYAVVGHLDARGHGFNRVVVTLLDGCETYLAPTGRDEVLVAVLGTKAGLAAGGDGARAMHARWLGEAHPELAGCPPAAIAGAGRFASRPATVARGRVFLIGDAAGFVDPLTGDGMSAGLVAARRLADLLAEGHPNAAGAYRAWERAQWRRRVFMGRLALMLSRSPGLARRALRGLAKRPMALDRLLSANDGTGSLSSLTPRDWAALGGL
jgi:flavin-dependent dehydrogenase